MISLNYYPDHTRASNVCNASVEINNSKQANQIQSTSENASIKKRAIQIRSTSIQWTDCLYQSVMTVHRCVKQDFGICLSVAL